MGEMDEWMVQSLLGHPVGNVLCCWLRWWAGRPSRRRLFLNIGDIRFKYRRHSIMRNVWHSPIAGRFSNAPLPCSRSARDCRTPSVCRRADLKGHGFTNVILTGYVYLIATKRQPWRPAGTLKHTVLMGVAGKSQPARFGSNQSKFF